MHEAAIAKSILEIIADRLRSVGQNASAHQINVIVGEFRNVEPESVSFAFDNMKVLYTGAEECELCIEAISALAKCNDNDHQYHPKATNGYRCPTCGCGMGKLLQGEELDVVNVVLEVDATNKEQQPCTNQPTNIY